MKSCKKLHRDQRFFHYGELAAGKGDSDSDLQESDMDVDDSSTDNGSDREYAGLSVN